MFKTNTISFPQETGSFFARMGVMKQFRPGDRVNSIRGPGDESGNACRPPKLWAGESDEQKQRFGQDASGHMVFAATIHEVLVNGDLALTYYDGDVVLGRGVEKTENVTTRVQMPWQPQQVQENLVILLRRNVGYGRILEGLEVRWGLVAKIMQALVRFPEVGAGPWREGGLWQEPMHKYYDPRLFDVLDEEAILAAYAPKKYKNEFVDVVRAGELRQRGDQ